MCVYMSCVCSYVCAPPHPPTPPTPLSPFFFRQATMQVRLLRSRDGEQELVGCRHAAALLCRGEDAKATFVEVGGR